MRSNGAYKLAPSVASDKRLDVSVTEELTTIQLSEWIEGLGWSTQKTLRLDEAMLDELHRLVTAARLKIKRDAADNTNTTEAPRVLVFPMVS